MSERIELPSNFYARPRGRDRFYDIYTACRPLGAITERWVGKLSEEAVKAWAAASSPSPVAAEGKSE